MLFIRYVVILLSKLLAFYAMRSECNNSISVLIFCLLCSLSYLLPVSLHALNVRNFGVDHGLASRQVYELAEDSEGFIWIYSHGGLQRFDGTQFREYKLPIDVKSRDYMQAWTSMGKTQSDSLWIALKSGQLFYFDPQTDGFKLKLNLADFDPDIMLYQVSFSGSDMLLSTSDGVYFYDGKKPECIALKGNLVSDMVAQSPDTFYCATIDGVYRLTGDPATDKLQLTLMPKTKGLFFQSIIVISNKLYAGSFNSGLFGFDLSADPVTVSTVISTSQPVNVLKSIGSGKDEKLVVGADGGGVYIIDPTTSKVLHHYIDSGSDRIAAITVTDISVVGDSILWIATSSNGISQIIPVDPPAKLESKGDDQDNSIISDFVNVVFEDSKGNLWYGTDKGLSRKTPDNKWSHYLKSSQSDNSQVLTISEDSQGYIWAGGYGIGVYRIDPASGNAVKQHFISKEGVQQPTDYVFKVLANGDNVWIAGLECNLIRYDVSSGDVTVYNANYISDAKVLPSGEIIFSGGNGIGSIGEKDTLIWQNKFGDIEISNPIRSIAFDPLTSNFLMATDGEGLLIYNKESGECRRIMVSDSPSIDCVTVDDEGKIWFTTDLNLYCLEKNSDTPICLTSILNLGLAEFQPGSISQSSDGNLMFGTTRGALTIMPDLKSFKVPDEKIIFNDLKVNYETVIPGLPGSILSEALDRSKSITLLHDQNSFSIGFSKKNFSGVKGQKLYCKLDNFDNDWWDPKEDNEALYRNVPPGKYTFRIKSVDILSGNPVEERSININVLPPLWWRWWAKVIYVVILALIGWFIYTNLRTRNREKFISGQIRSFMNLAHDLRTTVSLIKAPLGEIENQPELTDRTRNFLTISRTNTEKLLEALSGLLDMRLLGHSADKLDISPVNITNCLEKQISQFKAAAIQKNISISLEAGEDSPIIMTDADKFAHIIENLLSNAVKYSKENGQIWVSLREDQKNVTVEITDDGIGIPEKYLKRMFKEQFRASNAVNSNESGTGMGHLIVYRLVALLKGKIRYESKEGEGTRVILSLPYIKNIPEAVSDNEETAVIDSEVSDKATIMVVDDENEMADFLKSVLTADYNVVVFNSADDALAHMDSVNPDIVITDVVMKGKSGLELCHEIKSAIETSHIPVIILSGLGKRESIVEGLRVGANDYIVKPFDIEILKVKVHNILERMKRLRRAFSTENPEPDEADYSSELDKIFMDKVNSIIENNIGDAFYSIFDFCRDIGMSRTSAYNKLKRLTGESINEYFRIIRLNKAKALLKEKRYSVADVAYMVGFSDPKYFSTCFKKRFGSSPSKI